VIHTAYPDIRSITRVLTTTIARAARVVADAIAVPPPPPFLDCVTVHDGERERLRRRVVDGVA